MTSLYILNILYGQVFDICFVTKVCFHSSSTKNSLVLKKRLLSRIFFLRMFSSKTLLFPVLVRMATLCT